MNPYHDVYNTARWRKLRTDHLLRQPRCVRCNRRKHRMQVDHIRPIRTHPELAWDKNNLQTLCMNCHRGWKYRTERQGFDDTIGRDGWPIDPQHPFK